MKTVIAAACALLTLAAAAAWADEPQAAKSEPAVVAYAARPVVVSRFQPEDVTPVPVTSRLDYSEKEAKEHAGTVALGAVEAAAGAAVMQSAMGILLPMEIARGMWNQKMERQRSELEKVLKSVDLSAMIAQSLGARFRAAEADQAGKLEVLVKNFGLRRGSPRPSDDLLCLVLEAEVVLSAEAKELFRDRIALGLEFEERGKDVPPPICSTRDHLVENDARVLRRHFGDYSETLAAIVARRLPSLPWK